MKKLVILAAAAALFAGCERNEAKRFGYKGADTDENDKMFFSTGVGVTNWVPARILTVAEEYEMSAGETALIAAAGVIVPSEPLAEIPEGYAKSADEPWFTTWTKKGMQFGKEGVIGFISHYNDDRKVWETGETYFSSYSADEATARASLAELQKTIAAKFNPKKIHLFDDCFIAEYLRLRVMGVVGRKGDGTWSCMLDIQDKAKFGCGQYEPVPQQEERLAEYKFRKAYSAWKIESTKIMAANHEAVEKARKEKGLELFGAEVPGFDAEDGRHVYVRGGQFPVAGTNETDRLAVWNEKREILEKATGVTFAGEIAKQTYPNGFEVWGLATSNALYDVRLDMAFPPAFEEQPKAEGAAEGEEQAKPQGEWRDLCIEKIQEGFAIPPRPVAPVAR